MRSAGSLPFIAFSNTATFAASSLRSEGSSRGSESGECSFPENLSLCSHVENCRAPVVRGSCRPCR